MRFLATAVAVGAAVAATASAPALANSPETGTASAAATAGILTATNALSSTDVWSAGYAQGPDSTITPLTEHWDGSAWTKTRTPLPAGRSHGQLQGVVAVAPDLAWAVGSSTSDADGSSRTLIERWNGRKWQVVPTAEPPEVSSSYLQSVTAVSSDDAWAVGYYYGGADGDGGSIIEHWDGKTWSLMPDADPDNAFHASLQGVSGISARSVWATGFFYDAAGAAVTLTEYWNGKTWKLVESPNSPASPDTELHAVTAVSTRNAWATGFTTLDGSTYLPLVEHWDGDAWTIVDAAVPDGSQNTYLYAVDAQGARDVWATGYYFSAGTYRTLAEHWTGKKWRVAPTPNTADASANYLLGVSVIRGDDVWAAGGSFVSADVPFMQHWDGTDWTMVPVR